VPELTLHHAGYIVASIARSLEGWRVSLSALSATDTFEDRIQRARVAFLDLPPAGAVKIELVEPLGPDSPAASFLEKGGGFHHLCFEVDDLDERIRFMKANHAVLIRRPRPAVAFGGRRIAWMLTREKMLVEYLERAIRTPGLDQVK